MMSQCLSQAFSLQDIRQSAFERMQDGASQFPVHEDKLMLFPHLTFCSEEVADVDSSCR
jgi:hypothetical protein